MSHRWGPVGGAIEECGDCHLRARDSELHLANVVPCEHIWRWDLARYVYECDCGERVAYQNMLIQNFPGHCPIVGPAASSGLFGPGLDYPNETRETKSPDKYPKCRGCGADLCAVLDAYYGKDPALVGKCERCRGRNTK